MTDTWDWADHKAIGVLSVVTRHDEPQPVKDAWFWYAQHRHEQDVAGHTAVAEALREAYEAGRKSAFSELFDDSAVDIAEATSGYCPRCGLYNRLCNGACADG